MIKNDECNDNQNDKDKHIKNDLAQSVAAILS